MISTFDILGIPSLAMHMLFVISLALLLAIWLPGIDFGVLKIPELPKQQRRILRVIAPLCFLLIILGYIKIWQHPVISEREPSSSTATFEKSGPICSLLVSVAADGSYRISWNVNSATVANAYVNDAHVELRGTAVYRYAEINNREKFLLRAENAFGECQDEEYVFRSIE